MVLRYRWNTYFIGVVVVILSDLNYLVRIKKVLGSDLRRNEKKVKKKIKKEVDTFIYTKINSV